MFAFAIWDERERRGLIARDRLGIKPLYYHASQGRLVLASEVRALIASGLVPFEVDTNALYGYFRTGSVPEPNTLLQNVHALEAGHYAIWQRGALQSRPVLATDFRSRRSHAVGERRPYTRSSP